jgi:transposase
MVGQVQREEAKAYVRDVIARAANEALRAMTAAIAQEQLTRQEVELLQYVLLPDAKWAAQDAAYATMRAWKEDAESYATAFLWVAAAVLMAARAAEQHQK